MQAKTGVLSLPKERRCADWEFVRGVNVKRLLGEFGQGELSTAELARALGAGEPQRLQLWTHQRKLPWAVYAALFDVYGRNARGQLKHHPALDPHKNGRAFLLPKHFEVYLKRRDLPRDQRLVLPGTILLANQEMQTGVRPNGHAAGAAPVGVTTSATHPDGTRIKRKYVRKGTVSAAGPLSTSVGLARLSDTPRSTVTKEAKRLLKQMVGKRVNGAVIHDASDELSQGVEFNFNVKTPMRISLRLQPPQ